MSVAPVPQGLPAVCPYLLIDDARRFIAFMENVFDARVGEQMLRPDGSVGHTELRVRDSVIMLSEAMEQYPATPVMLYCYVEDCDATFGRAVEAGGTVVSPLANQFYGDRSGAVKDPTGNTLWIATHVEDVPSEELKRRAAAAMRKS